jgi:hypothetical protein
LTDTQDWVLPAHWCGPFGDERHPSLEPIEVGEPTIVIAISDIQLDANLVRFMLHVRLGFEAEFFHAFKHIDRAVVVTFEEPDTRRAAALRLIDDTVQFLHPTWPNFGGYDWAAEPSIVFSGCSVSAAVELEVCPRPGHAGVWIQASVLRYPSNRVHVNLDHGLDPHLDPSADQVHD